MYTIITRQSHLPFLPIRASYFTKAATKTLHGNQEMRYYSISQGDSEVKFRLLTSLP